MKRAGYAEAKRLVAEGWKLVGSEVECYLGGSSHYARLVSPTAIDGCYMAADLRSITWGCFKKLGGAA